MMNVHDSHKAKAHQLELFPRESTPLMQHAARLRRAMPGYKNAEMEAYLVMFGLIDSGEDVDCLWTHSAINTLQMRTREKFMDLFRLVIAETLRALERGEVRRTSEARRTLLAQTRAFHERCDRLFGHRTTSALTASAVPAACEEPRTADVAR